jgi:predicted alpha/beta-fold hydrolase
MPILNSYYDPPLIFKNGHISTVYSGLFRKGAKLEQKRERITLTDSDFIDLDWSFAKKKTNKLIILLHGLEGNAQRAYITRSAKLFNENEYDAIAMNFRSCSGEPNRLYRSYNAGATDDLREVVSHVLTNHSIYDHIIIKGFSLGGNMLLKYLGEPIRVPKEVKAGIAISVPCSLHGSLLKMNRLENRLYTNRFVKHLHGKLMEKHKAFPSLLSLEDIKKADTLFKIDDLYSSKAHGYKDALDYYKKCSSLQFLRYIKTPTLVINSLNDSFLSEDCYPIKEAEANDDLYLEMPKYGGHVGFFEFGQIYHSEAQALSFATSV